MPDIVPIKPVIAANTSLFHLPSNAMWAISRAERHSVMAMANFTPKTSFSFGCNTIISVFPREPLWATVRVNAFLIQSFMVCHFLLFFVVLG